MSQTTVNLGMVPNNRGEYNSAETYYKDNIVQYNGSSYICTAAMDLEHPSGITGVAPYDSDPTQPNTGWAVFVNNQGGGDDGIYDVSATHMTDNTPKSYNSLSDALADIIVAKRKGGMSMRFLLQLYTVVKSTTTTDPSSDTRYHTVTYDLPDSGTHVASDFPSAFSTELSGLVAGTASYYYKEESGGTYTTWTVTKVQSSDNKYVQYRYILNYAGNTTTENTKFVNVANWQGVDDEPVNGSKNLVKSGGVYPFAEKSNLTYRDLYAILEIPDKFNPLDVRKGGMYSANAEWTASSAFFSTGFIPAQPGDVIKIKWQSGLATGQGNLTCFQEDKVTSAGGGSSSLPMNNGQYTFTIPTSFSTTKYITVGFKSEIPYSSIHIYINDNETNYTIKSVLSIPISNVNNLTNILNSLQPALTAGDNITLNNNVIGVTGSVLYNTVQRLTDEQKAQGRGNINAANIDDTQYVLTQTINCATAADIATWSYGYIKPNGTVQTASSGSYKYSDKIYIAPDSDINITNMYCNTAVSSLAAYDAENHLITECSICQSTSITASSPVTIHTSGHNVSYIRITWGGGYAGYSVLVTQVVGTKTIKQKIDDIEQEISDIEQDISDIGIGTQWNGKSWVALGTSITDTNNSLAPDSSPTGKFVPYLVSLSGLVVTNKGVAGSVIGGHILYYAGHTSQTANAALVTIEGGVNDWAGDRPLGNVGDTVPYLVEWSSPSWNNGGSVDGTFAGACYQAIKTAMDNSPKAVVVVLTDNTGQYIASTGAHCEREKKNNLNLLQKDYTDMLIAVANYMGVPVINVGQKSMINQDNPEYLIDQIHHTELGGEQYAKVIWSELKNISNRVISD